MEAARSIDLNCDLGEALAGVDDRALMPFVSSCSIACGGHAGDQTSMTRAVQAALQHGVAIGAHPAYPDRHHFGRRHLDLTESELRVSILGQCRALAEAVAAEGGIIHHIKPHGALYHDLARDVALARPFLDAIDELSVQPVIYGLAGSSLAGAVESRGLRFVHEAFADRRYQRVDRLLPRSHPGAVLADPDDVLRQVESLLCEGMIATELGGRQPLPAETLCVHGDTPAAPTLLNAIRSWLKENDVDLGAPG